MRIESDFGTCILCLERPADTWEHVIPRCVGGRLQLRALCSQCNSRLGTELVSGLRSDPRIRIAFENLGDRIPELYRTAQQGLPYVGQAEDGSTIRVSHKGGEFRILPGPGAGGSTILDPRDARLAVERTLAKQGVSPEEIARYTQDLDRMGTDSALELPGGRTFVKQPLPPLTPEIRGGLVDDRLPALIAYEYLAFVAGNWICDERLDGLRRYLTSGDPWPRIEVTGYDNPERAYDTYHSLDIVAEPDDLLIHVRFFRYQVFEVRFIRFAYSGPDPVYYEDLERKIGLLAMSLLDARQGRFRALSLGSS